MIRETLYKRTSTKKIQIWYAEIDGDRFRTTSGQLDGKKTTADWTVCTSKNEGRSNALTAAEQAVAEVEALYVKQKKRDYRENIEDVDAIERFKPMLALKWGDVKDKVSRAHVAVNISAKLDGTRLIARADGLWTRNGEPNVKVPHIWEAIKHYFDEYPDLILDGELYNHDLCDDFNTLMSDEGKKTLQYWIYDLPSHPGHFEDREQALHELIETNELIRLVETRICLIDEVDETAAEYIEQGFEGAMIRLPGAYENKRSKTLLKWKEMQDEEFEIVDIESGRGNRSAIAARVILRTPAGRLFGAAPIGNFEYCERLLLDKNLYIGKPGTVKFQNYTPDKIPRFPKFKSVRQEQ